LHSVGARVVITGLEIGMPEFKEFSV